MLKSLQIFLWVLVAAVAVAAPLYWLTRTPIASRLSGDAAIDKPFTLTAADGQPFSTASLRGKPFAVFFGFTHCPDICPTTLAEMSGFLSQFGNEARDLRVLFVTVDPERDTAAVMKDYMVNFDPRIIALTGTPAQIDRVRTAYGAFAEKVSLPGGGYTMDHVASVYLMDRQGKFFGTLDYQEGLEVKRAKLRNLLRGG
jgi:protein SCO1/2